MDVRSGQSVDNMAVFWEVVLLFHCCFIAGVKGVDPVVLGTIPTSFNSEVQEGKKIILIYEVQEDGILYQMDVYTTSQTRFSLHVWDRKQDNRFELDFKKSFQPKGESRTETRYLDFNDTQQHVCPVVRRGDKIGLYTEQANLPIPKYQSGSQGVIYRYQTDREPKLGDTRQFDKQENDWRFPVKVYITKLANQGTPARRRKRQNPPPFAQCPSQVPTTSPPPTPSTPSPTPSTPSPTPSTPSPTLSTPSPTLSAPPPTPTKTATGPVVTVSPGAGTTILDQNTQAGSSLKSSKLKTMYIAIGVVSGVALIAIITAIILVTYFRRKRSAAASENKPMKHNDRPSATSSNLTGSPNPAYGINTDFMNPNPYESTNPYMDMDGPHVYNPIVPPRHGVPVLPERPGMNRESAGYEQIGDMNRDYLQLVTDDDSGVVSVASDGDNRTWRR